MRYTERGKKCAETYKRKKEFEVPKCSNCGIKFGGEISKAKPSKDNPNFCNWCVENGKIGYKGIESKVQKKRFRFAKYRNLNQHDPLIKERNKFIVELYNEHNYTFVDIAKRLHLTHQRVFQIYHYEMEKDNT